MSDKINDGGSAFPKSMYGHTYADGSYELDGPNDGMSLRDYFAAKAMNAIITAELPVGDYIPEDNAEKIAIYCYQLADAMLKERDK